MAVKFEVVSGSERDFTYFMNKVVEEAREQGYVLKQINYSTAFEPEHNNEFGRVSAGVIHSALLTFTCKED